MGTRKKQGNARSINISREAILEGIRRRPHGSSSWTKKSQKIINA
jgi:hypothetical protein